MLSVLAATLSLALLSIAAMVYPDPGPDHAAAVMVSEDGHLALMGRPGGLITVETARQPGATALQAGPEEFLDVLMVDDTALERNWVRETETRREDERTTVSHALRSLEQTGLREWVSLDGNDALALTPAALVLPADLHADQRWSSAGVVHDLRRAREPVGDYVLDASATASALGAHCLDVYSSLQVSGRDPYDTIRTWCPGAGVVAQQLPGESWQPLTGQVAEQPGLTPVDTAAPEVAWSPTGWTAQRRPFQRLDAPSPLVVPRGPVLAEDRRPVFTPTSGGDLLATTSEADTLTRRWSVHPGGTVTAVGVFGEMTVAATSRRHLVAYDDDGLRRWTLVLDDVVVRDPVRADDTTLLVADQSGTVTAVDIATGAVRWSSSVQADLQGALLRCGDVAVVADSAPSVTAVDLATGAERWRVEPVEHVVALACDETAVVVVDGEYDRQALEVTDGATRWRRPGLDLPGQLVVVGDVVVVRSGAEVSGYAMSDGAQRWRRPGPSDVLVAGDDRVAVARGERLEVLDPAGVEVATVTGVPAAQENHLFVGAGARGLWFVGTDGVPTWVGP